MKKCLLIICLLSVVCIVSISFKTTRSNYLQYYSDRLAAFNCKQQDLLQLIRVCDLHAVADIEKIKHQINIARDDLKGVDFWLRYLDPNAYRKINGPLPIEYETEMLNKSMTPERHDGGGLTLSELYAEGKEINKDSLLLLVETSLENTQYFSGESMSGYLRSYEHFYLCNRLFLLNLASIYTTGLECPDTSRIIPELRLMLEKTGEIYAFFNESFPNTMLSAAYLDLYGRAMQFVQSQPVSFSGFDRFLFIKNYINPLYGLNQQLIRQYDVRTKSNVDFAMNSSNTSIFDKSLFDAQDSKGIFSQVGDKNALSEIDRLGKLLFYDPILSGNNLRSCNSCHSGKQYFTDTLQATSVQFNRKDRLPRNSPSLLNAKFNQLLMLDGRHGSLQNQVKDVISAPTELAVDKRKVLAKLMSCKEYKQSFTKLLKYTPWEHEVTIEHIASAITFYYSKFSDYYAPFDEAMNNNTPLDPSAKKGFNLFMSKAKCGTCHYVPQFNGVKPPFTGSEFEVVGVPLNKQYAGLSADIGRNAFNKDPQTRGAFRTGTIRNAEKTKPYMHNGVFTTLDEVIDFYDGGGGNGHGLKLANQTLSSDSLHLSNVEKADLVSFMHSLSENIEFEQPPLRLPFSSNPLFNKRVVGGIY